MAKKTPKTQKSRSAASKASPAIEGLFKPFEQAGQNFGFDQAKDQLEKMGVNLFKGSEDLALQSKENIEAFVKSSQILAKSAEELSKAVSAFTQDSMEMSAKAGQALMGVKSVQDLAEVQSDLAKNTFEHFIAGTSKISDMAMKVANEALEPISARINVAVEKFGKAG